MEYAKPSKYAAQYPIIADTGVWSEDDCYHRTVILTGWSIKSARRAAEVVIRVARKPEDSAAIVSVWTDSGWARMISLHPDYWWTQVPGYQRGGNEDSVAKTLRLAADLVVQLEQMETHIDF